MMSSFKALSGARLGELMPTWPCDWIKRTSKGESGSWIANSDGNDSSFFFVSLRFFLALDIYLKTLNWSLDRFGAVRRQRNI